MNFRRIPFQFSATDPAARQRELEKRFGIPSQQKMFVDASNPLLTNAMPKETCSPRLQHRVPIFAEGYDRPLNSSVDSMGSQIENKKPNVRVIPIEVEGAEKPTRHRTFSGPVGVPRDENLAFERDESSPLKRSIDDMSKPFKIKPNLGSRVYNIPIQIEGESNSKSSAIANKTFRKESPKANGCSVSKSVNKVETTQNVQPETKKRDDKEKNSIKNSLKKIEDALAEFTKYETLVNEFSGTSKDKQYKYLDEMLTRCMLQLDNVDTMGNENVRLARKNAVKKVQASIDLLESKGNEDKSSTVGNEKVPEMSTPEKSKSLDVDEVEAIDLEMEENKDTHDEGKENGTVLNGDSNVCIEMQEVNDAVDETTGKFSNSNCGSADKKVADEQTELAQTGSFISSSDVLNSVGMTENIHGTNECQTNDIEMLDKNDHNASNDLVKTENISKSSMCQIEKQEEIPEVEMTEIQVSSPADLNLESEIDKVKISNSDRNVQEIMSENTSACNAVQDVEMEDHATDISGVTENSVIEEISRSSDQSNEQNIAECSSSHCKENESVTIVKAETSAKDSDETNIDEVSEDSTVAK